MIRIASKIWMGYLNALNKNPWRVQIIQTGTMMTCGDIIAQFTVDKRKLSELDLKRTLRFTILGSCVVGPLIRAWFLTLEKLLGSAVTLRITFAKVVLDQLLFAPSQQTTILVTIGALQGFTLQQIKDKVRNELYTITTTGWKIWPFVNMLNFYYVPFPLRPLVVSTVNLFWFTFLAYNSNNSQQRNSN